MIDEITVFPDTNVFLHLPPMQDIDWCRAAGAKAVRLCISTAVVNDLDAKQSDPRLGDRALRAIQAIRDAEKSRAKIRSGVTLCVYPRELEAADFADSRIPVSVDERIVSLARMYRHDHPGATIAIATSECSMQLRASGRGIATIELDPSMRLPGPQDEGRVQSKQVVIDDDPKSRQPRLSLKLARSNCRRAKPQKVTFELGETWMSLDFESEIARLRAEYPKFGEMNAAGDADISRNVETEPEEFMDDESRASYDRELEAFFSDFREYLHWVNVVGIARSRCFSFDLWLSNKGSAPANDIAVLLTFPPHVKFVGEKGTSHCEPIEKEPVHPAPPNKPPVFELPKTTIMSKFVQSQVELQESNSVRRHELSPQTTIVRNDRNFVGISVRLRKLKHGHSIRLGEFLAMFTSRELAGPFHAESMISTAEMIKPISQTVPFTVQVKGAEG